MENMEVVSINKIQFYGNRKKFRGIEKDGQKVCSRCMKSKSVNDFGNNIREVDGIQIWCKSCYREYAKNWYAIDSGRTRDQIRRMNKTEHSGKIVNGKRLCSKCSQWVSSDCFINSLCKECAKWYSRITNKMIKMEFIIAYGGKCSCCNETRIDLLTVEHIKDKGHKLIYCDTTTSLLWKLKKLNWPVGYDVKCYNCNCSTKDGRPCSHNIKEYKIYCQKLKNYIVIDGRKEKYYELKHRLQTVNGVSV